MEAGGKVTNYEGGEYFMEGDSVIATNGIIHDDIFDAIAQWGQDTL
jgi:myo-inositol-1(or 4)-monophosphatase